MKKLNLLEEISDQGYEVFLNTTYSFDPVFFEQMVLRHLLGGGCRYIGLFPDGRCFAERLAGCPSVHELGRSYAVQPIFEPQVFHPKVCLMAGPDRVKVMIGSFNLTPAGFVTNREVGNVFRFDARIGDNSSLSLVQAVVQYFTALFRANPSDSMQTVLEKLLQFSYLTEMKFEGSSRSPVFLNNLKKPLVDQLRRLIEHKVEHIDVMVPFFDRELSMVKRWQEEFEPEDITCWLQKGTTNFPKDHSLTSQVHLLDLHFIQNKDRQPRYHGKVFRLQGDGHETIIYGSANFSRQAWLLAANNGGNAETIVVETGPAGAFDAFFEEELTGTPLELSDLTVIEEDEEDDEACLFAYVTDSQLIGDELHIVLTASREIAEVLLDSAQGEVQLGANQYTVRFSGFAKSLRPIFELFVRFTEGTVINVPAWTHHQQELHESQSMISGSVYGGLTDDPYLRDYQNVLGLLQDFLSRLALTEDDLEQKQPARHSSKAIHIEAELNEEVAASSDREEDYFVSEATAALAYGSINGRDVLGSLIQQLLRPFREIAESVGEEQIEDQQRIVSWQPQSVPDDRTARSLRSGVQRFVKQFHRGIGSDTYLEKVTPDILLTNSTLYSHFLWKLLELQKNEAYLQPSEVWEELHHICDMLCRYGEKNVIGQQQVEEALIPQLLAMFVAKVREAARDEDKVSSRYKRKQLAQLLTALHRHVVPIRIGYRDMIPMVMGYLLSGGISLSWYEVLAQLEELFPFYPIGHLHEVLRGIQLQIKTPPTEDKPLLTVYVDAFRAEADFNLRQLLLLARMLRVEEWEEHDVFQITWFNRDRNHPLERYALKYNRKMRRLIKYYTYRNGEKRHYAKERVFVSNILDAAELGDVGFLGF